MKNLLLPLFILLSPALLAVEEWRSPEPENLVYMQLDTGTVVIELAPFMAPKHVAQFKALVKEGYYDGLDFYRVIDGFVAQGGDVDEQKTSQYKQALKAEFTRQTPPDSKFMLVQGPDFMAPEAGFLNGFPAGHDPKTKEEWLLHCPGNLAMARSNDADSATTDFYIVIGQATRHLDRNMSSFGRVIYGMPAVQALLRADINNTSGVIDLPHKRSKILWVKNFNDVADEYRLKVQVQDEYSAQVSQRLESGRSLDSEFFHFKGKGNVDVCYYQLKSRLLSK